MFKNPHVRKLILEALRDYSKKPRWAIGFFISPLQSLIHRQSNIIITATLIDGVVSKGKDFDWEKYVFLYVILNILIMIMGIITRGAQNKLNEYTGTERYPRYIYQALNFPHDLLVNKPRGEIIPKIRAKADFDLQLMLTINDVLRIALNLIATIIIIFSKNKIFALGYLIIWIISSIGLSMVAKSRISINKTANEAWDKYMGKMADIIGNAETALQFGNSNSEVKKIHAEGKILWAKFVLRWRAARIQQNVIATIQVTLNILLAVFGIWAVVNGEITIGTFVLLQTYIGFAIGDIIAISDMTRNFAESLTRAISLDEMAEEYPALPEPINPEKPDKTNMSIEFKDVSFNYSDKNENALNNLTFYIKKGEKIGIVGKSGAGKSTLTKLLLRIYLPNSGEVLIGGKTTEELGSENTRDAIAYVPQDPILFHRSIKENISYAKPDASIKEIEKVAKQAHCLEFIEKLPDGIDTLVGDKGVKLSGGQRQRVAIARAILKDSPILIFDEATSALDSESEGIIQDALKNVMKNKTSIVIAHRLSTLKNMDRIIVVEDGRIAEQGTHAELLKNSGIYAKLWDKQSGGFLTV